MFPARGFSPTRTFLSSSAPTLLFLAGILVCLSGRASDLPQEECPSVERDELLLSGHRAFVIRPSKTSNDSPMPWVWYAPTLGRGLPGEAEKWMFDRFHRAGIAVAGIDVGESYGSPKGRALYHALYEELTKRRGFHPKPVLLARSRGGLMLYNWAVEHPEAVGGIVGIYPVCNLASYPGLEKAAGAYEMTAEELAAKLSEHNPIERLEPLAKARVPIFHIHGDSDVVVPLEQNSALLAKRYAAFGGPVEVEVVAGQGHNMWPGWFQSERLTKFAIARALGKRPPPPQPRSAEIPHPLPDPDEKAEAPDKPNQACILEGRSNRVLV